ncbi:MAG: hypothetical protein ACRDY5_09195 [Acidimicrobiales bacterium]
MIQWESYLKVEDEFIEIAACSGPLDEPDYLDGFLRLTVDGVAVLDEEHWDLVDFLWDFLVEAMEEMQDADSFVVQFADQPTHIRLQRLVGGRLRIELVVPGRYVRRAECAFDEFVATAIPAATSFFGHLVRLDPEHRERHEVLLQRVSVLAGRAGRR